MEYQRYVFLMHHLMKKYFLNQLMPWVTWICTTSKFCFFNNEESLFNTAGINDNLDQNGFLLYEFRQSGVHPPISIEEIESMTAAIPPSS